MNEELIWTADWELHSHIDNLKVSPNKDFEQLGLVLIECMDGKLRSQDNTVAGAKRLRAANKVYGLNTAEKWSGCKQLIDLLDDMFSTERTPLAKMNKRVRRVLKNALITLMVLIAYLSLWGISQCRHIRALP